MAFYADKKTDLYSAKAHMFFPTPFLHSFKCKRQRGLSNFSYDFATKWDERCSQKSFHEMMFDRSLHTLKNLSLEIQRKPEVSILINQITFLEFPKIYYTFYINWSLKSRNITNHNLYFWLKIFFQWVTKKVIITHAHIDY